MAYEEMIDILAQLKAYLVTAGQFETAIAAIETARSVTIARPTEYAFVESKSHQYPVIEFLAVQTVPDYLGEDGAACRGFDYHYVDMIAYHSSNDRETVRSTLLYYALAIADVIATDFTFGDRFNRVRRATTDYSDMFVSEETKSYLQIMRRRLEIRQSFEEGSN